MPRLTFSLALFAMLWDSAAMAQTRPDKPEFAPSAMIETQPSEEKLQLIRRFMRASGLQARLDSGSFLERYGLNEDLNWQEGRATITITQMLTGPMKALKTVYEKYKPAYQEAYESHINWEFTDDELRQMIAFLESPVGQHFLDGTWRMDAYTGTNMEETEEALVTEAVAFYRSQVANPDSPDD